MTVSDYTPGSGLPPLVLYACRKRAADESPIPWCKQRNWRLVYGYYPTLINFGSAPPNATIFFEV